MSPQVTLVIPVHNCLPYLNDTLASAYHQSLPRDQVEVIAVDDGSTDGSSQLLADWAARWPQMRVLSRPASGTASAPRNTGIDEATGEYVFFLDGDDCLGPEALERLVAYAQEHDSDVVLGRIVGIGRKVRAGLFDRDEPHTRLDSGIYHSLLPFKLIRRSLLLEHKIRFPEDMRISEDQPFMAQCYLAAGVISTLGSYPCYYLVRREGGTNTSLEGLSYDKTLAQTDQTFSILTDRLEPGPLLASLVGRHVQAELLTRVKKMTSRMSREQVEEVVATASPYAHKWDVPGLDSELTVGERLLVRGLQSEDCDQVMQVVDWLAHGSRARAVAVDGEWFQMAPGYEQGLYPREVFRLPGAPVGVTASTDARLDGTTLSVLGHACIVGIPASSCEVTVHLEHAHRADRLPTDTQRIDAPYVNALMGAPGISYAEAGFRATASLDRLELASGRWRLVVTVATTGLSVARNVLPPPVFHPSVSTWTLADATVLTASLREGVNGNVVIDVRRQTEEPARGTQGVARRLLPRPFRRTGT